MFHLAARPGWILFRRCEPSRAMMRSNKASAVCVFLFLWMPAAGAQDGSLDALARTGHWKRVRMLVQERASLPRNEAETAYWQARVKQAFRDDAAAEVLARRAVSLDGSKAAYHAALSSICLDELSNHPSMLRSMRLAHETKGELERALSLDPQNVDILRRLMEYDWYAPAIGGGDRKKARELADEIGRINPTRGCLAQARLSETAGENGISEREALLKKAVAASPRDYEARLALAEFYGGPAKQYALGEQEAKVAVALAPDRSRAYADLAVVYVHEQKWEELDELVARAERAVSEDLTPYYQAAKTLLVDERDYDRAERYFRRYLSQEAEGNAPTLAEAHWRLGLLFEKRGMKQKAIEELETSHRLQPNFAAAQNELKKLQ